MAFCFEKVIYIRVIIENLRFIKDNKCRHRGTYIFKPKAKHN